MTSLNPRLNQAVGSAWSASVLLAKDRLCCCLLYSNCFFFSNPCNVPMFQCFMRSAAMRWMSPAPSHCVILVALINVGFYPDCCILTVAQLKTALVQFYCSSCYTFITWRFCCRARFDESKFTDLSFNCIFSVNMLIGVQSNLIL